MPISPPLSQGRAFGWTIRKPARFLPGQPPTKGGETSNPRGPNSSRQRTLFPALSFPIFLEAPAFVAFVADPDEEPQEFDGEESAFGCGRKSSARAGRFL